MSDCDDYGYLSSNKIEKTKVSSSSKQSSSSSKSSKPVRPSTPSVKMVDTESPKDSSVTPSKDDSYDYNGYQF